MAKLVTLQQMRQLHAKRPEKFSPDEVGYEEAPEGSAIRCAGCIMYYRRSIDNLGVCQIMRDDFTDDNGVYPDWRCQFQTVDGDVFPLLEED